MTRRFFIAGNWKMNITLPESHVLISPITEFARRTTRLSPTSVTIAVFPSFVCLHTVVQAVGECDVVVGAQDCSEHAKGAFTGEVSAHLVASTGATHVLVGHSERRTLFGDTSAVVSNKVRQAFDAGLTPILCIGETTEDRISGTTEAVLDDQLSSVVSACTPQQKERLIIAYEPVWAIGTGTAADVPTIADTHAIIRAILRRHGGEAASGIRILYGGSVTPANASEIFRIADVDGALIGGASLKAETFLDIVQSAMDLAE
ncbi:MAG: triose-phosphate isomerase [Candidatus Kapaibacterium sp.]